MGAKKKTPINDFGECPTNINDRPFYGLELDNEQKEFINAILNPDIDIIFCNARAGTGKTTCATGAANILVQHNKYKGIVYIVSSYGEQKQGYLPGDITEKSSVYFEPFYQALIECDVNPNIAINNDSMVNQKTGLAYITCLTHTFLRGTNFDEKIIILDESQNFTVADLKKTLTRCNDRCKVIVIGHEKQCDLANPSTSGFAKYIEHFKNKERCKICSLTINHRGWVSQWADELED